MSNTELPRTNLARLQPILGLDRPSASKESSGQAEMKSRRLPAEFGGRP